MKNLKPHFRRLIILGLTLIMAILVVVFGSMFYISKEGKKSIEYAGGAEYVVKIEVNQANSEVSKQTATDVAESIYERLNPDGLSNISVETEKDGTDTFVRVRYSGIDSQSEKDRIEKVITEKPHLIFTNKDGEAIFDTHSKAVENKNYGTSLVPLENGGAKAVLEGGQWKVQVSLSSDSAAGEFTKATGKLVQNQSPIYAWLDIEEFISKVQQWNINNPINAIKVSESGSSINPVYAAYNHLTNKEGPASTIRTKYPFDATKYLISAASVSKALSGRTFVIEGNFSHDNADQLSRKINYGASNYSLKIKSSNFVDAAYGSNAFDKALIAGIVVFSLISIFLIVNYGLLGALSTISIALYTFLTLLMFTVMRGEYSPESIAALILGLGMSVDANIITFERLKNEVYSGASLNKANKTANKRSLTTIFDANITTLIVAFVLFFFGTRNIKGLSVTLIISIFFTLVIMLGFTRITATLLIRSGAFEERKKWLGIKPKFDVAVQNKLNKFNYIKHSKWFAFGSILVMLAGILTFSITAGVAGSTSGGINLSQEFAGGAVGEFKDPNGNAISELDQAKLQKILTDNGAPTEDVHKIYDGNHKDVIAIQVKTKQEINLTKIKAARGTFNFESASTSNDIAKTLVRDAMIAIAIAVALIILYTLIRFRWTYSLAAIIALVHDGLIVTAIFIVARLEISPIFIAGLLSILGYSINDTIVTFDRIREKMHSYSGELTKEKIVSVANEAIKDTIKRSLLTSFTTMMAVVVLMAFGNATKLEFNIAMLVGLFFGTYSSIFIASWIWVKMEIFRVKKAKQRKDKNFWKVDGIEEETVKGINDFNV